MTFAEQNQYILDRADIVDIISQYLPEMQKKGVNYVGNCPFHDEKTGSFTVSDAKKIFTCFGCSETGNAIDFIMKHEHVSFMEARNIVAFKSNIFLDEKSGYKKPDSTMSKVAPQDEFTFEKKDFSKYELTLLGPKITPEICKEFNFISLKSFTRAKNHKGESWKIESAEDFPIFMYEFDGWGKIYQPLSDDYRFSYYGDKPDSFIFGTKRVMKLINKARKSEYPGKKMSKRDIGANEEGNAIDERLSSLILCSGGTDAMNLHAETEHQVCFLNSETADLSDFEYNNLLKPIVLNGALYVLFDLDNTGIEKAYNLGLRFIDLKIINLPSDLRKFRDRKGRPCKDVKDFFVHYKHLRYKNLDFLLKSVIKTSLPLRFWDETFDKEGIFKGYDINNEQLYGFLAALGIYRLPNEQSKKMFVYIHLQKNIVKVIPDEGLQSYVNEILVRYLKENLNYWSVSLINTIHRSNQVKIGSLEKLHSIYLDFKSYGKNFDFLFFRNTAVKVTAQGLETIRFENIDQCVYESKILDFDYRKLDAPFDVSYTQEYLDVKRAFDTANKKDADYSSTKRVYDKFDPLKRFALTVHDKDFSTFQYLYNTGRTHWRKEEAKMPLDEEEIAEHNLHFINKVMALGYLMFRYKDNSRPYMVYGMETDLNEVGTHMGGTGKSMFFILVDFVRSLFPVDGQNVKRDADETMFAGVHKGITDFIYFDDLHKGVDLHKFMPMATGNMIVRNLYENRIVLPYEESPKVGFSSNHGLDKFDSSMRRRTWFTGFSSYYHPEDQTLGLVERSPRTEFGYNIPKDYTDADMNRFYNFMVYCLHTYIKFGVRVNPPMENIEKRMMQRNLTDEFIWWADEYFDGKLNTDIDKNEIFEAWKLGCLSESVAKSVRTTTLKKKMEEYCRYHKYIFNPQDLLITESEIKRGEKRDHKDGKDIYLWHIRTANVQEDVDNKGEQEF